MEVNVKDMDYYGYAGQILRIDLSSGKINKESLSEELIVNYLGGVGIQFRLINDFLKPGLDPYSPEAPIIVGTGPLTGTLTPLSGRTFITVKSPAFGSKQAEKHFVTFSSSADRRFGAMLKNASYDHVVITGRARSPSYLKIIDDNIEVCDASDLWGKKGIFETSKVLAQRHRGATGVAGVWAIGKAGENLVRFAHGIVDMHEVSGRHGVGAVLGSKNLKAVVVLGTKGINIAGKKKFVEVADRIRKQIVSHPNYHKFSPDGLPVGAEAIRRACMACPIGCKFEYVVKEGRFFGERLRVSYPHTVVSFAREVGLKHYGDSVKLLNIINDYGIDWQTIQGMLRFLTRLYERGVLTAKDTGGLELKFGDFDAYVKLIDKIVNREDIGNIAADGWYPLIQRLGADASADFKDGCPVIKGVAPFMADVRGWGFGPVFGLGPVITGLVRHRYAGTHWALPSETNPEGKRSLNDLKQELEKLGATGEELSLIFAKDSLDAARVDKVTEEARMVCDLLGVCDAPHSLDDPMRDLLRLSELYSAVTGTELSPLELREKGEKVCNLIRILNVREGFTREDDAIPSIWLQNIEQPVIPDLTSHRTARGERYLLDHFGQRISRNDIHKMIDDYYEKRGWDIDRGVPTKEKLLELGLGDFTGAAESALNR